MRCRTLSDDTDPTRTPLASRPRSSARGVETFNKDSIRRVLQPIQQPPSLRPRAQRSFNAVDFPAPLHRLHALPPRKIRIITLRAPPIRVRVEAFPSPPSASPASIALALVPSPEPIAIPSFASSSFVLIARASFAPVVSPNRRPSSIVVPARLGRRRTRRSSVVPSVAVVRDVARSRVSSRSIPHPSSSSSSSSSSSRVLRTSAAFARSRLESRSSTPSRRRVDRAIDAVKSTRLIDQSTRSIDFSKSMDVHASMAWFIHGHHRARGVARRRSIAGWLVLDTAHRSRIATPHTAHRAPPSRDACRARCPRPRPRRRCALLGMGNPLLDISVACEADGALLSKYDLKLNDAILGA